MLLMANDGVTKAMNINVFIKFNSTLFVLNLNAEQDPYQSVMLKTYNSLENDHKMGVSLGSTQLANLVDANTTNLSKKFEEKGKLIQSLFKNADKWAKVAQEKTEEARKLGVQL